MDLNSSISIVNGIGPVFIKLLARLEIYTVGDLLYHFPFRYEDYSNVKMIRDLVPNETVSVQGHLIDIQNIFTRNGKRLTKGTLKDESGVFSLIWFNQHYLKKTLALGEKYFFSGKVQLFDRKLTLVSPTFEKTEGSGINSGRLVPIYPETSGVNSKWLRTKINDILSINTNLPESLPANVVKSENFQTRKESLRLIHFPDNLETASRMRERFAFEELFYELIRVEHRKRLWNNQLEGVTLRVAEFMKQINLLKDTLPFSLSESQEEAIAEIYSELSKTHPMNRLLEGDVGSGKTIVAVFASYLCYLNGYKTLYMAPTEILASQHFLTFQDLLGALEGPKIALKTGSVRGDASSDIIIGTHALLHTKEDLSNVGLVIIDEQHRFGVEQRTKIAGLGKKKVPNLLTMTATPIPRTLTLTLYGDLSISHLETPSSRVRNTITRVIPENKWNETLAWIKQKNVQAFIVCPLIEVSEHESLENVASAQKTYVELSQGVFKGMKVGLLHGRMKPSEKADVIEKFRLKEIDILVSTPVIEVGIDVPSATIMVIQSSERYGLASLHQLRGRVGRDGNKSYCLLFLSNYNPTAYKRLKYMEEETSGLKLAEIDLRLRGGGDAYGTLQSGFTRFKLADITNVPFLEKVKLAAQECYRSTDSDPVINRLIKNIEVEKIGNN
jgi:ATP-dependent DNA helicase RecG